MAPVIAVMLPLSAVAGGYLSDYNGGYGGGSGNYLSDYNNSGIGGSVGRYLNDYNQGGFSLPGGNGSRPAIPRTTTTSRVESHTHSGHRAALQRKIEAEQASKLRHSAPPCGAYMRSPKNCAK